MKVTLNDNTMKSLIKMQELEKQRSGVAHALGHFANVAINAYVNKMIPRTEDYNANTKQTSI